MSRLRVESFSISVDGFGAGPDQDLVHPLGVGGEALHTWAFATTTFQSKVFGGPGGSTGVDEQFAARGFRNIGAWILGRNMFGPIRGPWPDETWKGWWGDNPPYHVPTFVLSHHPREPIVMEGGTTFHFVTDGIHDALSQAARRRTAPTSASAAASPPSVNSCRNASSTNCIWRSPRSCSAPASTCSPAST